MKTILFFRYWIAIALLAVSSASLASVWAPSDGNSNFIPLRLTSPLPSMDTFGIFEDNVNLNVDAPILTFKGIAATVLFTRQAQGPNYTVSLGSKSGTLLGSSNFQIAWLSGNTWRFEAHSLVTKDGNILQFSDSLTPNNSNSVFLYAFDVVRSQATSDGPSAVPLPASAWMMVTAVMGLLFSGRRKSNNLA